MLWLSSHAEHVVIWVHMRLIGKGSGVPVEFDGGWGLWFRSGKVG